jgi:glutamate-1-semialdehyde 2,1-aminomutase
MGNREFIAFDPDLEERARKIIAHGALTNSKRPAAFVRGVYPTHLTRGQGCFVWDTRGNRYIDFICGLGTNLLGYAHEEIRQAISDQAKNGCTLSLSTELEVRVAERIREFFPFIERLRFLKNGGDACQAAVRISRAFTGQLPVYSSGYHGWGDEFTSMTPPAKGVALSPFIHSGDYPQPNSAACIIEPVVTDFSAARKSELEAIKKRCQEAKTPLIFDEVITGFRFPKYSVTAQTGVTPDLICLGKALGGGLPLSVVAGRADMMDSDYFVSLTFAGETLALAACMKFLDLIQGGKYRIDALWEMGQLFLDRFNSFWPEGVRIEGYPTRGVFKGDPQTLALFWQEACKAGLLFGPSWFFCFPHIEVVDQVLNACQNIMTRVRLGEVKLEGEIPQRPYAQLVREEKTICPDPKPNPMAPRPLPHPFPLGPSSTT